MKTGYTAMKDPIVKKLIDQGMTKREAERLAKRIKAANKAK
jgi:hypothetical protein